MFDADQLIADRMRKIDASGIRRVFDLAAKMENPINLSIGQPDFDVPEEAREAAIAAIRAGQNRYTVTQGIPQLLARVRQDLDSQFRRQGRWEDYGLLATSGVSGGLVLAMLSCIGPGDEVIVGDPYFVMYKHLVTLAGGKTVFADTYPDFQLTAARVEPLITPRTKMLVLATPSNPTGVVTNLLTCRVLAELCRERGILMVSDEIYDLFCHEPAEVDGKLLNPSPALYSDSVLVLRGFSKSYGMTGWRLGFAAGPKPILDQMTKLQQYTFVCAPSMVQAAGAMAMNLNMRPHVEAYRRKRDMVVDKLKNHFQLTIPGGAFYAFPQAPRGLTGSQFVEKAIERKVLIIPGSVFSERDTHFRLSYACPDAQLEKGLDILVQIAES